MNKFQIAALGIIAAVSFGSAASAQQGGHYGMTAGQHHKMLGHADVTHATGVVQNVDASKGMITIAHDPIASRKWPAMTMPFNVSRDVLGKVKAGQRVKFSFQADGSAHKVIKIRRR